MSGGARERRRQRSRRRNLPDGMDANAESSEEVSEYRRMLADGQDGAATHKEGGE